MSQKYVLVLHNHVRMHVNYPPNAKSNQHTMLEKPSKKVLAINNPTLSGSDYLKLHEHLVAAKTTTGENKSEAMVHYTMLNWQRTKRVLKTMKTTGIEDSIKNSISKAPAQKWILISEPWCGDASQSVPVIIELAKLNPAIKLDILLRDDNLEVMDQFLTNGGRSIPKLIRLNPETNEVISDWGPRPEAAQDLYLRMKEENLPYEEMSIQLQNWYNKNSGKDLRIEIAALASL